MGKKAKKTRPEPKPEPDVRVVSFGVWFKWYRDGNPGKTVHEIRAVYDKKLKTIGG